MVNALVTLEKIKKTKLTMLVALVVLNILATISLFYMMTNSTMSAVSSVLSESVVNFYGFSLNVSLVFAAIIAILWLIAFILFYEMKTDDEFEKRILEFEVVVETRLGDLEEHNRIQKLVAGSYAVDPDKIK